MVPFESKTCSSVAECDGTSYATAWNHGTFYPWKPGGVNMSVLAAGDTLYICGEHATPIYGNVFVTIGGITVSGNCPNDPGKLTGSMISIRADDVTVQDLEIVGGDSNAKSISIINADGAIIRRIWMHDTRFGIYTLRNAYAHDVLVEDCIIDSAEEGILLAAYGSDITSIKTGWTIRNNYIANIRHFPQFSDADREAIGVQGAVDLLIENNLITHSVHGIVIFACEYGFVENLTIRNNTVVEIRGEHTGVWTSRGIIRSCRASRDEKHILIEGNVVVGTDHSGIRWHAHPTQTDAVIIRDNILAATSGFEVSGNVVLEQNIEY